MPGIRETRPPRPELAYERAIRSGFDEVAGQLSELLPHRLVAYIGGVKETRAVDQWAVGDREPDGETQTRLRLALQVALMIEAADGRRVTQEWFQGMNPELDDRAPARVLRDGPPDEAGPAVLGAARAFVVGG